MVDDRMTQISKDIVKESTKAKMQAVEGVMKDMRVDVNKNLQQINVDMNNVKAEVDKQLTLNQKELINESKLDSGRPGGQVDSGWSSQKTG